MGIKRIFNYYLLGKSIKDIEMDKILDKISKGNKLTKREYSFLDLYNKTKNVDNRDFMLLSKLTTLKKIKQFLSVDRRVICDINDRDGKIGKVITGINFDVDSDLYEVIMNDSVKSLQDKYLYNLMYNSRRNEYSLQEHDEYYEKIEV